MRALRRAQEGLGPQQVLLGLGVAPKVAQSRAKSKFRVRRRLSVPYHAAEARKSLTVKRFRCPMSARPDRSARGCPRAL
jgi:hypothetical protein